MSWLERTPDSTKVAMRVATLDSANHWTAASDVIRASDLFVNWADFPAVVQLADGRLLAHWLQNNSEARPGRMAYDIRMAQSVDNGSSWTPVGQPNFPGEATDHGFVSILPRADSTADILFLSGSPLPPAAGELHGPPMRLALSHMRKNGQLADSAMLLDLRTCDCCQTAAAVTSRGPVILYRDRSDAEIRDIAVRRFVNGAWTDAVPLNADGWMIAGCPVNGPAISAIADTVAAVWFTAARDSAKVQLTLSLDAGVTFEAPIRIDAGHPVGRVDVKLLPQSDALVTWIEQTTKDSTEVCARLVRRDGTTEPSITLAQVPAGRATGFPRMARRQNDVVLAWSAPGKPGSIKLASLTIAPR